MRKTKIICTLGPAVAGPEMTEKLIRAGMNVARFNFSHGDHDSHRQTYEVVEAVRTKMGAPVATLLDTRGPEVRCGLFNDDKATLETGQSVVLTGRDVSGDNTTIPVTHKGLYRDVSVGSSILLDDGLIALTVTDIVGEDIVCTVLNGGVIKNRKGINVPGVDLSLPYLSDKDKADITFGAKLGFDYLAASFVTSADDIFAIRAMLEDLGRVDMGIIAKIESGKGLLNLDEILEAADGVMVARGDLGVEIPVAEVPVAQKQMMRKSLAAGKIVIVATQMLESMTQNPRPTRAEAADVANAIYEGATAIMLSGETAAGNYPIETVTMMSQIAERIERDIDYPARMSAVGRAHMRERTTAIAHATCSTAHDLEAAAIVTVTCSGHTARMISSFRPDVPILGCTPGLNIYHQLGMLWGVEPVLIDREEQSTDLLFKSAVDSIQGAGYVRNGDLVVITAGVPIGIPGTTNLMKAHVVGDPMVY